MLCSFFIGKYRSIPIFHWHIDILFSELKIVSSYILFSFLMSLFLNYVYLCFALRIIHQPVWSFIFRVRSFFHLLTFVKLFLSSYMSVHDTLVCWFRFIYDFRNFLEWNSIALIMQVYTNFLSSSVVSLFSLFLTRLVNVTNISVETFLLWPPGMEWC